MRGIFEKIFNVILFLLTSIIAIPLMIVLALIETIRELLGSIMYKCLSNRKYNEKKVKKKLYNKLRKILSIEKEINICKEFWIPIEEYDSYTTLKYLFTGNKISFIYRKGCDKYLYNFYDFNAHKDGFVEKWIEEIKNMFDSEDSIKVEEVVVENSNDNKKNRNILRISSC